MRVADPFETLGISPTMDKQVIHQAYRALARRWHPDRFAAGPERLWAEAKMLEINSAYAECIAHAKPHNINSERKCFDSVKELLVNNQPASARRVLMEAVSRTAEWNYLFGLTLAMLGEARKAVTYLSVAAHQQPQNAEYQRAYREAEDKLYGKKNVIRRMFARSV